MKNLILLKVLQSSVTKANPNYKNTGSRKSDAGFTIIELLVVVIMLGALTAIAAPGWLGFINRQRVRTVNDQVFQSLRFAQSEAKRTKRDITITFDTSASPTATIDTVPAGPNPLRKETFNGGGEIKPGTIALVTNAPSITFDYQGNVKDLPSIPPGSPARFVVTVAPFGSAPNASGKKCAIIDTLIGGMRTAEGNDPVAGCP
jgi:prepilin-type N-terminal cleavage/methylation domain-containing protein